MKQNPTIVVALPLDEKQQAEFRAAAPQASFRFFAPDAPTGEDVWDADILVGKILPEVCKQAQRTSWYQANAAGPDAYLAPGVFAPEVHITTAVGAYGLAVGEHMLAMTMALLKRLPGYRDAQHEHVWVSQGQVASMWEAQVLVLGMGDLGGYYARLCAGMGAHVIGLRRHVGKKPDYLEALESIEKLDELLPRADIVALCLPGGADTYHIIGGGQLARMKKGAVLVNGGRGTAIDPDALLQALRSGALRGAALDVTEPEPLPTDHPLWDEPNVLITPHVAGFFYLEETVNRLVRISTENLRRYLAGEPLKNEVNRGV